MTAEPVLFTDDDTTSGRLLFAPRGAITLANATNTIVFEEGLDYALDGSAPRLVLLPGSRIPQLAAAALEHWDGTLLYPWLTTATYSHASSAAIADRPPHAHARTIVAERLARGQDISVCVLGDSISEGYDATGFHGMPPYGSPYPLLLAEALQQRCRGGTVSLHNLAVAGSTAAAGTFVAETIATTDADIVIVAFGMNDATYADADEFGQAVVSIVRIVTATLPRAGLVLVSPMLPTPACGWVVHSRFEAYASTLDTLSDDRTDVVNLTAIWKSLLQHKSPYALSGNGLNHPNDFGHRVYAEALLSVLT